MRSEQSGPWIAIGFVLFGLLVITFGGFLLYHSTHDAYDHRVEQMDDPDAVHALSDYEREMVVHDFSNVSAAGQRVFLAARNASGEYTIYRVSQTPRDFGYAEDNMAYGSGICFVVYEGEYYRVTTTHDWAGIGAIMGSIEAGLTLLIAMIPLGYGGRRLGYGYSRVFAILLAGFAGIIVPVALNLTDVIVVRQSLYPLAPVVGFCVSAAVVWQLTHPRTTGTHTYSNAEP